MIQFTPIMPNDKEHDDPIGRLLEAHQRGENTTSHVMQVLAVLGQCENAAGILASVSHNIP